MLNRVLLEETVLETGRKKRLSIDFAFPENAEIKRSKV